MRSKLIFFLTVLLYFISILSLSAQYGSVHKIDSVMDMSPAYLHTEYARINSIEFEPLIFQPVDTGMVDTHQFDPLFKTENYYQNLGIVGQAHKSVVFGYQREMGFLYQTLPYPLFFKKQSDLNFYRLKTTYSKIVYALSFQKEHEVFAEFAKCIKGVTVAANVYGTFNEGTFVWQSTRNLRGDILVHYEIPSSIYGFRASYIVNDLENQENGGLIDIYTYQKSFEENKSYGVRFTNAISKITTHDLVLQNYVNLINKNNKNNKKPIGTFTHNFQFEQTTIRYNDKKIDSIYPYYNAYTSKIMTEDSTRIISLKNAIQWSNFSPFQEMENKNYFFYVAVGGMHDYTDLKFINTSFNTFYLFARTNIRLFKVLDITGNFSYSFNDDSSNDIIAKSGISFAINREKAHQTGIEAQYFRNSPEYMMQYVSVNNFRWINQFKKQNIAQFKAYWNYQNYNVSVSYYLLNNLVNLSEELRPVQNEKNGNLFQCTAYVPFRIKNFGTTANLNFQYCDKEVIHVPFFAGKLSIYYILEFFKKRLKIQVGSDFMYNTSYYADAYLPVLHKFYNQKSQSVGDYIFMDIFLTINVDRINFFFRAGNLLATVMKHRNFTTPNYPDKEFLLSLGVRWRFFD